MANPLERPGAVALLEDAAHLLRRTSFETVLCHWIGTVPLAMMLLVFWNDVTHPPMSDLACAGESLATALLLMWMNCWRSVFAGRLRRGLGGAAEGPWNGRRVWRLIANQTFLSATKLVILPLSLLAVYPFAATVAFYRNASVLAGREDLRPFEVIAKARRLERAERFEGWLLLFLLHLFSLVVIVNAAIALLILPQLVKMLTGYESAFTRGAGFAQSRLFVLSVLSATWLVFDPFVQAVYSLRCFARESIDTGEDLLAALRRVRSAAARGTALAAVIVALGAGMGRAQAADAVGSRELEKAVRTAMQSPEYNWRIPPPPSAAQSSSWIIAATERAFAAIQSGAEWAGKTIERVMRWVFSRLELPSPPAGGRASSSVLHWSIWVLIALAAAITGWVLLRLMRSRPKKARAAAAAGPAQVRLDDEGLAADRLPEAEWLEMAERALLDGNPRLALRAFYLANLAWLGEERLLTLHAGRTNREFEIELRRRARESQQACELFSLNVRAFERAWYGLHEVPAEDAKGFRQRAEEIKMRLGAAAAA